VQPLVLDLQLDGSACCVSAVVLVGHDHPRASVIMLGLARRAVNELRGRFGLRALVWAVLLATLAVALQFVPLFDVLGYDFSFALGLAGALAGADVRHGLGGLWGRPADAATLLRLCWVACGVAAGLLALPLLIS